MNLIQLYSVLLFFEVLASNTAQEDVDSIQNGYYYNPLVPDFDKNISQNITALVGKTAVLTCRISNSGNKTISWVRHRDIHLLTVGRDTYTSDQRFQSVHKARTNEWTLQIRFSQERDSGIYECQISTTPPIGHFVHLIVIQPNTTIVGAPEMYISRGSTINITCIVERSPEPPSSIQWTHNRLEINYDSPRGGVSVITEKGEVTISYLLIQRAKSSDSGIYACSPSNAVTQEISVHVLNGNSPEAMQHGDQAKLGNHISVCFITYFLCILQQVI